jgi:hypothetical protein
MGIVFMTMISKHRQRSILIATTIVLIAGSASGADRIESVEAAFEAHHLEHTKFDDLKEPELSARDGLFLRDLFELIDEFVLLNANVTLWFFSEGEKGTHAAHYLERNRALAEGLHDLEPPARAEPIRSYLVECARLQHDFIRDWLRAIENGSDLDFPARDENAYHEGLHRSERLLLKTYAEMRAVFPRTNSQTNQVIRSHLHAMGLQ